MTDPGDFASMFESSPAGAKRKAARLEPGQQVEGTILAISGGLVILDIGSSADASLDLSELNDRTVKVGDRLRATVSNPRSDGPELTLSLGRGGASIDTKSLELALQGGTPVSGTVTASNKGGFSVDIANIRAFCPLSQIDLGYVNDPTAFVGQTLDFQVVEIKEGGRDVVVSRRKLLMDERRKSEDAVVSTLSVGATIEGTVKGTVRHGAIVDLGGMEGFIPLSELSRARIERAEDVVSVGEKVTVRILSAERGEKGLSIRLSLKALEASGEKEAPEKDEILAGKVVKHVSNGLIVSTPKGEGLVPTRELSLAPGADHRRTYPIDTALRVVVVSRDPTNGKVRFSVDRVAQVEERNNFRDFHKSDAPRGSEALGSLGELMNKKFPGLAAQATQAKTEQKPTQAEESPVPPPKAPPPQAESAPKLQAGPAKAKPPTHQHHGVRRRLK